MLAGKTIRWTFADGPMPGMLIEHTFDADGGVTWRFVDGPHKGASGREKSYAAAQVNDKTIALSYLAASGHTLTVILSLPDGKMFCFGSSQNDWQPLRGTFEFVS